MPTDRSRSLRLLALLCVALLSCTTIRTPVSYIPPSVALRDDRTEPQLELWVESNRALTPEEHEGYRAKASAALEQALAGRDQPDGDQILVVRAQGVTRTPGHRGDQKAATVGMVVGAVVIVAAVIIAVVASGKSSGSHGSPHVSAPHAHGSGGFTPAVARSGGGVRAGPPMFPTVPAPRTIPTGPTPRRFPVAPAPGSPPWYGPGWRYGPEVDVDVGFWWEIPLGQEPPPGYPYAYAMPPPMLPPEPPPADVTTFEEPTAEPQVLTLAPPVPFPVGERGFFAGDRLALEAVVLDRTSGETLWTKRVSREADPCNPKEMKDAVDALLSDGGWIAPAPDGN